MFLYVWTFRKESINSFKLDTTDYLSTTDYTWDWVERFTSVRMKLISDAEEYQSMIRGYMLIIFMGCTEANNKFLRSYNPRKAILYISYLDANNLNNYSMMQRLPNEILDWVNPEKFILENYSDNVSIGCFLEVDIDYPDELHNFYNDYPLVAKKIKVTKKWLNINYKSQKIIIVLFVKRKIFS